MTDQEINEAVARKLGWDCCYRLDAVGWHRKLTPQGNHFHEPMPDYCHSIEAAWEIVEYAKSQGYWFQLDNQRNKNPQLWIAEFTNVDDEIESDAEADTAQMAICLAFLKLT